MKIISAAISVVLLSIFTITTLAADTYVKGYTRKDGTYVRPHYRSTPDKSYNNNWSVRPNVNPYTGKRGTRAPTYNDRPPQRNSFGTPRRSRSLLGQ